MRSHCCHLMLVDICNRAEKSLACCEEVGEKCAFQRNLSCVPSCLLWMANQDQSDSLCQVSRRYACKEQDLGRGIVSCQYPSTTQLDCSRTSCIPGRFGVERVIREKAREFHKMHVCICAHRPTVGPSERWEGDYWGVIKRKILYNFYHEKL